MARIWERLQDPPGDSLVSSSAPSIISSTSNICFENSFHLPFIEVGNGKPIVASNEILNYLNIRNNSKDHFSRTGKINDFHGWNWPTGLLEWTENEIAKIILDVICRKLSNNSLVGFVASDSIEPSTLAKMQMATTYLAAQEGLKSLLLSADFPLPIGMPKYLGIWEYLVGKASLHDIINFSIDGKAALITEGSQPDSIHFCFQENTYLGLLKSIRRRFNLVLSGFDQCITNTFATTFFAESDGIFIVANEGEDSFVDRWQKSLLHQGMTYLGWIRFKSQFTSHAQSRPSQSPFDWRQAG